MKSSEMENTKVKKFMLALNSKECIALLGFAAFPICNLLQ